MKEAFMRAHVQTPEYWQIESIQNMSNIQKQNLPYPLIAKKRYGSRGEGIQLVQNLAELNAFLARHRQNNWIIEKYYSYSREYRLHVHANRCFYTCRKMLRSNTPDNERFYRNDRNCTWVLETNPQFDKPANWDNVVREAIKSLNAVGLDVGAIDMRTTIKDRENNVEFLVIETNSAPSFRDITAEKYKIEIPIIAQNKYNAR